MTPGGFCPVGRQRSEYLKELVQETSRDCAQKLCGNCLFTLPVIAHFIAYRYIIKLNTSYPQESFVDKFQDKSNCRKIQDVVIKMSHLCALRFINVDDAAGLKRSSRIMSAHTRRQPLSCWNIGPLQRSVICRWISSASRNTALVPLRPARFAPQTESSPPRLLPSLMAMETNAHFSAEVVQCVSTMAFSTGLQWLSYTEDGFSFH